MPYDFSQYLVIGISSRALFNLDSEHEIYINQGLEAYEKYQLDHEDEPLRPGSGFPLVKAILNLNTLVAEKRKTECVLIIILKWFYLKLILVLLNLNPHADDHYLVVFTMV